MPDEGFSSFQTDADEAMIVFHGRSYPLPNHTRPTSPSHWRVRARLPSSSLQSPSLPMMSPSVNEKDGVQAGFSGGLFLSAPDLT